MSGTIGPGFPDEVVLRLMEEATGKPIQGVAVTLTLHARSKNDYHFAPLLSNSVGTITIGRNWIETSIEETRDFFAMDHESKLEDCLPYVDVKVMSSEDINRAVDAARLYKGVKQQLGVMLTVSDLRGASNHAYEPQEVRVSLEQPDVKIIEVPLSLRRRRD